MKIVPFLLLSSSILLATGGCTSNQSSNESNSVKSEAALHDIYEYNHSVFLFRFGNVVKTLSQANSPTDLIYAKGYIDSYLMDNPNFIPGVISENKSTYNKLVVTKIQADMDNLFVDIGLYTKYLQNLVQKDDIETIKKLKPELDKMYMLERELNDDRYSKEKEVKEYQEKLKELHFLIKDRLKK
ncbi:hypothetical protein MUG87_18620 [Ectobacillus sp. JY-23]|uniref:hypothetical protein n=1 Tax=Ectobacillus sp. JY-23 TaxID=2933872 RepID=UPI001FF4D6E9|nr:hypothetical protein [Ectobacillus sp. JY-23]UOY92409.1 hypothetical protein MUG87_18620 [Ectobacillus sp. JY-23]